MSAPRRAAAGVRSSLAVLTVLPVGAGDWDGSSVLPWAPLVGGLLAAGAAGVCAAGHWLFPGPAGALLTAAVTVAALVVVTGGLHVDGLADTADGLGRRHDRAAMLAVMRRPDVGAFGVVAVVATFVVQAAALGRAVDAGRGPATVAAAVVCGRLALLQAGVPRIPAARSEGLGRSVAGSVPVALAATATAAVLVLALLPLVLGRPWLAARLAGGLAAGCLAAAGARARLVRHTGGITGDLLGALCEVAVTVSLVVGAVR